MKKIIHTIKGTILCLFAAVSVGSCHYLDVDPELGLSDDDVFSSYKNFSSYFYYCYNNNGGKNKASINLSFPLYQDLNRFHRLAMINTTDAADCGYLGVSQLNFKQCNLNQDILQRITFDTSEADSKPMAYALFHMIRQANLTIERIDECKNITEQQYNDLLGQCYTIRGYCHFALCRLYGGMPYIDHTLGADDEWDLARESTHSTFTKAAEDCYRGYELLKQAGVMRRDARPGQPGHLQSSVMIRPNAVAALGIRARCLLYAASPLSNELGEQDWINAADACAEALAAAEQEQYELLPMEFYTENFVAKEATNEVIWGWAAGNGTGGFWKDNNSNYIGFFAFPQTNNNSAGGMCPTQNFVDKFETIDGYALNTPEDRAIAEAAGSYMEQDPYALAEGTTRGRDPRFHLSVVHDGTYTDYTTGPINIHYDPATGTYPLTTISGATMNFGIEWGSMDSQPAGYSNTGYYMNKYWTGARGDKQNVAQPKIDPLVRLADLYLMYAEAVNEVYGPNGTAGGYSLTALEAINKVRARVNMPPVRSEYTSGKDTFRERIRNERNVELCFEGHHYFYDIRRWKIAPQTMDSSVNPLYGMYVEKCDVTPEHPAGRKYERRKLAENRQGVWKDCMYYLPFPDSEALKMKNFVNNAAWR